MIYRFDFIMYFEKKSDADWIKAQADQRLIQAVVAINPERINAEHVSLEVKKAGRVWVVQGMIAFRDTQSFDALAYCKDAFDTFAARLPWTLSDVTEEGGYSTSLSYHNCRHEEGGPCTIIEKI